MTVAAVVFLAALCVYVVGLVANSETMLSGVGATAVFLTLIVCGTVLSVGTLA